jgi:hypothetical protein
MDEATENKAEKSLEKVTLKKPLSVYSLNFSQALNNFAEKRNIVKRRAQSGEIAARRSFSKKLFNRRNAALLAAILTIGVLHFALQMSFIRREVSKTRPVIEVPAITVEPDTAPPVKTAPAADFKSKKDPARQAQKAVLPLKPRPQFETTPSKTTPTKKKEAVESRAERLRRAERLLTGL